MLALGGHQDFVEHTERNIQRGKQLLEAARDALDAVQERYDSTEEDHLVGVADLFADIGDASSSEPLADHGTAADYGTSLPAHEIPPAENFEGIPDWAIMMMEFGGSFVSPTYWAMKVLEWTIGTNPLDWAVAQFAGDWDQVAKAGNAFTNTGAYWTQMGTVTTDDCAVLMRGWEGDAARSAESWFRRLAEAHTEQEPGLTEIGRQYRTLAQGMHLTAKGVGALLGLLADIVAGAAILAAAIAVASASVVGAPAAAAMTTSLVAMLEAALGVWGTVLTVQGATVSAALLFAGVVAGACSRIGSIEQLEMPNGE